MLQRLVPSLATVAPRLLPVALYNTCESQAAFWNIHLRLLLRPRVVALDVVLRPRGMSRKREQATCLKTMTTVVYL